MLGALYELCWRTQTTENIAIAGFVRSSVETAPGRDGPAGTGENRRR